MSAPTSHPILTCDETRALEEKLFDGDEAREWPAMQRAGRAIAAAVLRDFEEIGGCPSRARLLVLAGKGHNGGSAGECPNSGGDGNPCRRDHLRGELD